MLVFAYACDTCAYMFGFVYTINIKIVYRVVLETKWDNFYMQRLFCVNNFQLTSVVPHSISEVMCMLLCFPLYASTTVTTTWKELTHSLKPRKSFTLLSSFYNPQLKNKEKDASNFMQAFPCEHPQNKQCFWSIYFTMIFTALIDALSCLLTCDWCKLCCIDCSLVADVVLFNSQFNRDSFLNSLQTFLHTMPDCRPSGIHDQLQPNCYVLYYPLQFVHVDCYRYFVVFSLCVCFSVLVCICLSVLLPVCLSISVCLSCQVSVCDWVVAVYHADVQALLLLLLRLLTWFTGGLCSLLIFPTNSQHFLVTFAQFNDTHWVSK